MSSSTGAARMKRSSPRVAVVTNVLAHYRVPCFQRLAEQMPGQVTFFLLAEKMEHRSYVMAHNRNGLPLAFLAGWKLSWPPHDDLHVNNLFPILQGNYDVLILGGYEEPSYLLLWILGVLKRQKILFWIESTAYDLRRSGPKEAYKRFLLGRSAGCIVPGKRAYEYCRQLGMRKERIFTAPNAADRIYFQNQAEKLLPIREDLKRKAGLEGLVILFAGRLLEVRKGVSTLIKAVSRLERNGQFCSLLLAGEGPDLTHYQELAKREGLKDIRFLGLVDHQELCRYYALADVFVLPSRSEPWGFVLNEGMEFGLPLVVSEAVGAGPDLVQPGENGFMVPVGDEAALARVLGDLGRDETVRRRMGESSRTIIERFSPENWAKGVVRAIEAI